MGTADNPARFQLDLGRYQLLDGGRRVRLERQPMELLILLVRRHGELVTREEITAAFWGKDVFVDAEQSINRIVRKLRLVLHDDPDKPQFVETVVGKGYRFIGRVDLIEKSSPAEGVASPRIERNPNPDPKVFLDVARERHGRIGLWLACGVAIGVLLTATIFLVRRIPTAAATPARFAIDVPAGATLGHNSAARGAGTAAPHFAPSPDGRRVAYVMFSADQPRLWVRRLDEIHGQPLPGTDDASFPFWSADSRHVAFFADGKLKRIDASGGPPRIICDAPAGEGGTWNADNAIVFAPDETSGLAKVSAAGGVPVPVTTLSSSEQEVSHRWPQFLPDGRHFLYLALSGFVGQSLISEASLERTRATFVGSLDSPQRILVMRGSRRSTYAGGRLLFMRQGSLMSQALDLISFRLTGNSVPLADNVSANNGNGRTGFAASDDLLMYRGTGSRADGLRRLLWVDRAGQALEVVGPPARYGWFRLSPDASRLAIYVRVKDEGGSGDLNIARLTRGTLASPLTLSPIESEGRFAWSPDGSHLTYASGQDRTNVFQKSTTGSGEPERLLEIPEPATVGSWSPDGRYLAYSVMNPKTRRDLFVLPLFADRNPIPVLQTEFNEFEPEFSPDGKWVAYVSDRDGSPGVYLRAFPSGDREWRVSTGEGISPRWRGDGNELFYFSRGDVMGVGVKLGPSPELGAPKKLFSAPISPGRFGQYSVTPDGQRFLIIEPLGPTSSLGPVPLTVVLNWTSALPH
jgi:Tol biopolymer transport system component/DNA-binding winged helix-turn-helix (wHTH) protein